MENDLRGKKRKKKKNDGIIQVENIRTVLTAERPILLFETFRNKMSETHFRQRLMEIVPLYLDDVIFMKI